MGRQHKKARAAGDEAPGLFGAPSPSGMRKASAEPTVGSLGTGGARTGVGRADLPHHYRPQPRGIALSSDSPEAHFLIVAGVGPSPAFNATFGTEPEARIAFRSVRLERLPRFRWAELLALTPTGDALLLCWFRDQPESTLPGDITDRRTCPPAPAASQTMTAAHPRAARRDRPWWLRRTR